MRHDLTKYLLITFFNISLCGFSQTNIKAPDGWFNQIPESGEFSMQNLEIAFGKEGARRIKNLDKYKDYVMVVSSTKYDIKSYNGVSPTINFVLVKNKLNWHIEDFQNTNNLLLSQLKSSGMNEIELIEDKFLNFKNGEKAYKMKVEYKLPNFNSKIITTNISYFITNELYAQLTLMETENDKCTETFGRVIRELNLIDN
jgi:hypothetical protein